MKQARHLLMIWPYSGETRMLENKYLEYYYLLSNRRRRIDFIYRGQTCVEFVAAVSGFQKSAAVELCTHSVPN
jgi:hypothetical protein